MTNNTLKGSVDEFDENWRTRPEAKYNHWVRGAPTNQVQLAFRSHWEVFQDLISSTNSNKGKVLEVGCGRGSLSSYFVDAGWDADLLDYSASVIATAKEVFRQNKHEANFTTGDAYNLPFDDNTFDVTTSIGLFEHFEQVRKPIAEQLRVLKPGGWFLAYIVPERPDNVQRYFNWVNSILKLSAKLFVKDKSEVTQKSEVYRSDSDSKKYIKEIAGLEYENLQVFGMYPLPMLSHSPEFPFTLLPKPVENVLTKIFTLALSTRKKLTGQHGWKCKEENGQAFLLAFQKKYED